MKKATLAALFSAALVGCSSTYEPLVLCHNANCTEPANPAEDDTVASLNESLALRSQGKPVIDGIEIDLFWAGDTGTCLFAHDLPAAPEERVAALVPATILADYLKAHAADATGLTRSGGVFTVHVELKGHVGKTSAEKHTDEQRGSHSDCALEVARELQRGADAAGTNLEIIFSSFSPRLLSTLVSRPSWPASRALGDHVKLRVSALQGIPPPLDRQTVAISNFGREVDMVMAHPHWVRDGAWEAYRSRNWDVAFWMFSGVVESLDAIEHYQPKWVTTSEAMFFLRWRERSARAGSPN
jgi:hypothetical protein